ncbi:MAG: uracil-DNA glycosylase [Rickettsiales bacterium]|nr:uracil-DNA glycosylase [Rickettsiales bacterium]
MGNQGIAILEWYQAMGVDEWVEETPQNHLAMVTAQSLTQPTASTPPNTVSATAAPAFIPETKAISPASNYTPPAAALEKATELAAKATTIAELREAVMNFKELSICKSATQPVFAQGAEGADLMVIGEAPGTQEDRQGTPFCGPSGQLLDKMLAAIGMSRETNAYITHTVFWRPPGNRTPTPEEITTCQPFVRKHIELAKPKLILLLGGVAVRSVLDKQDSISRLRGKNSEILDSSIEAIVSYHPSYLLRQPNQKKLAWQDLLRIKAALTSLY